MTPDVVLQSAGWEPFGEWPIWRFLLEGLWLTSRIAIGSILLSLVVGILMAVGRLAPLFVVRWAAATYVEVFRATPLLLLIFFVFYGVGRLELDWLLRAPGGDVLADDQGHIRALPAAVVALTLYNSAVVAEIMRAGILSIGRGIIEATRALGLSYLQSMRYVAIPMAFRRMAPGLVSQLITLFKDTSLVGILGIFELLRSGRAVYDNPAFSNPVQVLLVVSALYFIPCYALSLLAQRLEQGPDARAAAHEAELLTAG